MNRTFSLVMLAAILTIPGAFAYADSVECNASGKIIPWETETPANENAVTPGTMYVEPATLHSLGFEWMIQGDANRNAQVSVRYRQAGETAWRSGMDLLRIKGELVNPDVFVRGELKFEGMNYVCPNMFAGSVLFLQPGATYEVELKLSDPDGGAFERIVRVPTKSEPRMFTAGRPLHVYPADYQGQPEQPVFDNLAAAYDQAQPGDRILLHAGEYATPTLALNKKNTRERPIVIMDAGDGVVTLRAPEQEGGRPPGFDVTGGQYHWIEGLRLTGYYAGVWGTQKAPTIGLTVRHCEFLDTGWAGVLIAGTLHRDLYIADNVCRPSEVKWLVPNEDGARKFPYKGVWVGGQGIDVCYNLVIGSKDGVSVHQPSSRPLEAGFPEKMVALDFYNNDIRQMDDDNEADGGQHNIRFFHNRIVDQYVGLSAQPVFGGPCYFVRNVLHNIVRGTALKFNLQPAGVVALNNTILGAASTSRNWSNCHLHNNLFLAATPEDPTFSGGPLDPEVSTISHNGFLAAGPVSWLTTHPTKPGQFRLDNRIKTLADLKKHGVTNSVTVSYDDFVGVKRPLGVEHPNLDGNVGDFRLKQDAPAIDAGKQIPNVTDNHSGAAPDLGACEFGTDLPHYGPRKRAEPKD
ncbi:right-handed parallel beta-helix repeat-containing protein [Lignipirellula cremea]|uniref:Right handed beta helix domain-containing protein n=1 Tax=Lignipirellula cremea TaxID=2528010 RepID=A0A518DTK6_9BACT|nr:hypothetical protein [Lignipirellula cremea]QDU95164.1 hypothetical protein Pla8534_29760 [Lignipirellula cremea]